MFVKLVLLLTIVELSTGGSIIDREYDIIYTSELTTTTPEPTTPELTTPEPTTPEPTTSHRTTHGHTHRDTSSPNPTEDSRNYTRTTGPVVDPTEPWTESPTETRDTDCFQENLRTSGDVLKQVRYTTDEDCKELCLTVEGCKAVVTSPMYWYWTECFIIGEYALFTSNADGWDTAERTCFDPDFKGAPTEPTPTTEEDHGYIFNAEKNVNYELSRALQVNDVITAWGVYKDHTTSKFNVNIRGSNNLYLLHVDFRPYHDVVVLNSHTTGWQTEIRPAFSRNNLQANKLFSVRIEVHDTEYRIFYNGVELAQRFPQRQDIAEAAHVALHGGSNGFQWSALHLPGGLVAGPGIPFPTSTAVKNYLDRDLVPGDVITAWGIYATASSKFNVNLMKENDQHFMIHVDFRPPPHENKVVLNSKKQNGWEREIRTTLPTFVNGRAFKVEVKCLLDEFQIFVDGNELGSRFPYRDGFSLSEVKFVWLLGGSNGMVWTDLALPPNLGLIHIRKGRPGTDFRPGPGTGIFKMKVAGNGN